MRLWPSLQRNGLIVHLGLTLFPIGVVAQPLKWEIYVPNPNTLDWLHKLTNTDVSCKVKLRAKPPAFLKNHIAGYSTLCQEEFDARKGLVYSRSRSVNLKIKNMIYFGLPLIQYDSQVNFEFENKEVHSSKEQFILDVPINVANEWFIETFQHRSGAFWIDTDGNRQTFERFNNGGRYIDLEAERIGVIPNPKNPRQSIYFSSFAD